MHPVFTPALIREAGRAAADAYKSTPTHRAGEAEGCLVNYGDGWHLGIRGTEFDGSGIVFGDMLIDVLAYPVRHPVLGWVHKGFTYGRIIPDANQGGAVGLFRAVRADLKALGEPYVIDGHSKGGAQTVEVGALLTAWGLPPKAIVAVDPPRFAIGRKLWKVLDGIPVLKIVAPASPVNKVPLGPWWNNGPGETIEVGPPNEGLGDITAHKIARINRWTDDRLRGPEARHGIFPEDRT